MQDFYLKFLSEEEANSILYTTDVNGYKFQNFANIDIIGTIEDTTGWHVNVRVIHEDSSSLEPYVVVPTVPVRVWA